MKKSKTFIEMTRDLLVENPDWTDYSVYDLENHVCIVDIESSVSKWSNRDILKDISRRTECNKIKSHYINFKSNIDDVNMLTVYIETNNFYICVNTVLST